MGGSGFASGDTDGLKQSAAVSVSGGESGGVSLVSGKGIFILRFVLDPLLPSSVLGRS